MSKVYDFCLIGLGPAGVGFLSATDKSLISNSICFEQGSSNERCICHMHNGSNCNNCEQCSIISGIGGASRFSCGKISNYPAGSGLEPFFDSQSELIDFLNSGIKHLEKEIGLKEFIVTDDQKDFADMHFKKNNITYKYYDVYEFNRESYINFFIKTIECAKQNGLNVQYNSKVLSIDKELRDDDWIYIITVKNRMLTQKYEAKKVVLATGNITADTIINNKIISPINFTYELGVRITVPTDKVLDFLKYHGDLKLKHKNGKTYCVSKNGFIIAYSVDDMRFLEGYIDNVCCSNLTNLAIIFRIDNKNEIDVFKNNYKIHFNGNPIKQKYLDFINNLDSKVAVNEKYFLVQNGNIRKLFNNDINSAIIDFIDTVLIESLQVDLEEITLYAPEFKTSKSYFLSKDFQGAPNLYIIGAATGKFRGILQSFCSGIHCANEIRV